MAILILGGYGFIGQHMAASLMQEGHEVHCSSRNVIAPQTISGRAPWHYVHWDGFSPHKLLPLVKNCSVIINLIGANIGHGRWTKWRKKKLLHSRLKASKALALTLRHMKKENIPLPKQLIQASASGYYGLWDDCHTAPLCTENSLQQLPSLQKQAFLPSVCEQWEKAITPLAELDIHVCILRFAPVIGRVWHAQPLGDENSPSSLHPHLCAKAPLAGMLRSMIPPFQFYMGGVLGSGQQPLSWIHIFDVAQAIKHIVHNNAQGIYNVCSPYPACMQNFVQDLGTCLDKPTAIRIPPLLIRAALGQMGEEILLQGQKCLPQRLLKEDFTFRFTRLTAALNDCLCQEDLGAEEGVLV